MELITYPIVPLSEDCGLMGWLSRCHGIRGLVRDLAQRLDRIPPDSRGDPEAEAYQAKFSNQSAPQTDQEWAQVAAAFDAAEAASFGDELDMILVMSAADSNDWLVRKKNYSASLASTTIAGYIIGLGDRHINNIMLSLPTGKLVHIDFTHIMEQLQNRTHWPEQVPCRLTPAILRPLDVLGPIGEFKRHCIALLEALQNQADQIVELLAVFVEDPLSKAENLAATKDEWEAKVKIIKGKLAGVDARLAGSGVSPEGCMEMTVEMHVDEIIRAATDRAKLKRMWVEWRPWW
jgi:FKBP12-rapamycin complex-associated protein